MWQQYSIVVRSMIHPFRQLSLSHLFFYSPVRKAPQQRRYTHTQTHTKWIVHKKQICFSADDPLWRQCVYIEPDVFWLDYSSAFFIIFFLKYVHFFFFHCPHETPLKMKRNGWEKKEKKKAAARLFLLLPPAAQNDVRIIPSALPRIHRLPPFFFSWQSVTFSFFFFAAKEGGLRCTRDQIRNQPGARRCAFILIWVFFFLLKRNDVFPCWRYSLCL